MKKNILNLGKTLSKSAQKTINGGSRNIPCFEWCELGSYFQSIIPKPLFCNCGSTSTGGGNNGGNNGNGPIDKL